MRLSALFKDQRTCRDPRRQLEQGDRSGRGRAWSHALMPDVSFPASQRPHSPGRIRPLDDALNIASDPDFRVPAQR